MIVEALLAVESDIFCFRRVQTSGKYGLQGEELDVSVHKER